jgi:aromatic ring hydroxylase
MMLHWARATCGMMGRSPDFMNVTFAAWAAAGYFAQGARSSVRTSAATTSTSARTT